MTTKTLGRFEIIREIGKGAMGVVYLAHDPKIDRNIAIKMIAIPAGVSPEESRESRHRFVREAQAAGKLAHPNIITIYDVVEEDEVSYIAMEYIEGGTLEAYTKPATLLPLNRVLPILAQACAALDFAHKNQVIHRDIKPANLMLMQGDLLKITDFGLAKSPQANLTQAGVLIGTPNYMSPEQISGRTMDGRSDFFSLGVVLYELLTGERPFSGDTISTIIYRILYEEPRPPRILNAKLPPAFDGIIQRALAKEPADRFQSGADFVDALNNYSTYHLKSPVSAAPPTVRVAREPGAPGPVPAPYRPATRLRPAPRSRNPIFAGQPLKVAVLSFAVLLAVLFFPKGMHEPGRKDQLASARATPSEPRKPTEAGFNGSPFGGPGLSMSRHPSESAAKTPLPAAGNQTKVEILVDTRLFLDNQLLKDPVVSLPEGDSREHTLVAVLGCREQSLLFRGDKLDGTIDMRNLQPKVGDLVIDSKPDKADVYEDGKLLGVTPQKLENYDACEPHTFELRKENYKDFLREFDGNATWSEISQTMASVSLSQIPPGFLQFESLPSYPLEVFDGKKPVPIKEGRMTLSEGIHELTLKSPKVFFSREVRVEVAGAKTGPLKQEWPGVGSLTIQVEPSKCKVFVDGEFVDYPPIIGHEIVAGKHDIEVVQDTPEKQARKRTVTIEAGKTSVETFTFNP